MGDFPIVEPKKIDFMDVAPNQIASISACFNTFFLEHDDANRALMGSNMMRQAVPLVTMDSPIVGTGLEKNIALDSRMCIRANGKGVVEYVDSKKIIINYQLSDDQKLISFDDELTTHALTKFKKTNQNTCINLIPIVKKGDKVLKGQFLTSGYAIDKGGLLLVKI